MSDRRSAGFSLVEILAALALLSVLTLTAARVWEDAAVLSSRAADALRDPDLTPTRTVLRADVQGATAIVPASAEWSAAPLELRGGKAGATVYELVGGRLLRRQPDAGGHATGERAVLASVTAWRWRLAAPGLVDIEITVPRAAGPWQRSQRPHGGVASAAPGQRVELLRFACRGGDGGRSW